jgi:hypothetical protein
MMGTMMEGVEHEKTPRLSRLSNTFGLIEPALNSENGTRWSSQGTMMGPTSNLIMFDGN